ncbi:MAG: serine/threonine protein kinase [Pseudomonadota bacterium]|nr:serine/threonine protein kinase [Pseudomonadota bacterium]
MSINEAHPYDKLSPDVILDATESAGYLCDGFLLAMNSYENRVYQVGIHDEKPVIVKFYRPGRWSDAAILEEHEFARELDRLEIPVVAPLADRPGETLHYFAGYRFAVFPRRSGRPPNLENEDTLSVLGRFLGRLHACGSSRPFRHRTSIDSRRLGHESRRYLLSTNFIPEFLTQRYSNITADLLETIDSAFAKLPHIRPIRLHGDCHPGNLLWSDRGPHIVDLDDCATGPAIQDLWMLISGDRQSQARQLATILEGYQQFNDFDFREITLIESLRTLRMIHHSAWLARRWNDPAFPRAFPWFDSPRYWEEQILILLEQRSLLDEPTLELY